MPKRSVAKPTSSVATRRRRKLTDYGGSNTWEGSKDNLNVIHQMYRGRFDRFERYRTYEWMDQDSDVSRALDLIAEHCSERDHDNRYFQFDWSTDEPTAELSEVLKAHMDQWSKINRMEKHLYKTVRNVLKYGDWFMFRNPNTFELYDIHPMDVMGAIVDRNTLDILGWMVRDFRWNIEDLEINVESREIKQQLANFNSTSVASGGQGQHTRAIPATHILHFSMSEGKLATAGLQNQAGSNKYSNPWPFGMSWLEKGHKTFKQRELLEDAAIIHRVQRAPSRHVWYIDTGKMRHDRSKYVVQNFKNELNQKRIPQFVGKESKGVDSVYNPISQLEDYYIPVSMDQRGSKVEQLEGTPWSDMPDLDYFSKKMMSAMRVPYAWLLPSGEGGITPSDGRMGQATQEEIEFSRFCSRVHTFLIESWDHEFKLYSRWRDVNANWSDFELQFIPPTDYEASKERARLIEAVNAFKGIADVSYISKRILLKDFLGWSEDKIAENERMVDEELNRKEATQNFDTMGGGGGMPMGDLPMGGEGLEAATDSPTGADNMGGDLGGGADLGGGGVSPMGGFESVKRSEDPDAWLFEDDLELPTPKRDLSDLSRTPKDKSVLGTDQIAGQPLATLAVIQRLRHAHFSKRVDGQKRLKMLNRIYAPAADEGGGPPGLGGI